MMNHRDNTEAIGGHTVARGILLAWPDVAALTLSAPASAPTAAC